MRLLGELTASLERRAVDEVQRVREREVAGAFAFAGGLALGPAKEREEVVARHDAVRNFRPGASPPAFR